MRRSSRAAMTIASLLFLTRHARAEAIATPEADAPGEAPLDARADNVSFNARSRELELDGNVIVNASPFHLTSDHLLVKRSRLGVDISGKGRVAFCPCLGTPVSVAFGGATLSPPGDLFVRDATLRVYGVPLLYAPLFWLRSAGRVGLLPPEIAYRGADGVFLGGGIHAPLKDGDEAHGIDLRGGGYARGGFDVEARLSTDGSETKVRWDRLLGADGVVVDARGAFRDADRATVAWDVDAIRGTRGVVATTDLDAAARVYDRASAEAAWRTQGAFGSWTLASGVRGESARGSDGFAVGAGGPFVRAHIGGAIGSSATYDAAVEGGALRGEALPTLSFARGEGGANANALLGALVASVDGRLAADVANDGVNQGVDAAASARAKIALPLGRAYATNDAGDPLLHRLEPRVVLGVLSTHSDDVLGAAIGRGLGVVRGTAWFAGAELFNALGFWGRHDGAELTVTTGAVGTNDVALFVARARAAANVDLFALSVDGALVAGGADANAARGEVAIARARVGRTDGLHLASWVAARDGVDPVVARVLTDASLSPSSGFLATTGVTYGAALGLPLGRRVTVSGGADEDATARELVAARAALELHDPCGCFVVRASAAHRIGREGVDAWLTVDIAPRH